MATKIKNPSSVYLVTPLTKKAKAWVNKNVGLESWQWMGPSFAVEWRYVEGLVDGMQGDGLRSGKDFSVTAGNPMRAPSGGRRLRRRNMTLGIVPAEPGPGSYVPMDDKKSSSWATWLIVIAVLGVGGYFGYKWWKTQQTQP